MPAIELQFHSELRSSPAAVWRWATSVDGILREMRPGFRMTFPRGMRNLGEPTPAIGRPLFRSRLYLLGFVPWGSSNLTLIEWREPNGEHAPCGFVEQSEMTGMRLWRHARAIEPCDSGCRLADHLTFEPRFLPSLVAWFVRRLFEHRHAILRRNL